LLQKIKGLQQMSEKKALYNRKIPDLQRQNKKMSEGFIQRKFYGIYTKLVDCLEKCLIYGHIRRVAD